MDKEFANIFLQLMIGFDKENEDTYGKLVKKVVSDLTNMDYDMKDPDIFHTMFVFQKNQVTELIAKNFHEPCEKKENQYKADFVFTHYDFLENHIRRLIECRCGLSCIADKCHTIIKEYLKWLISGQLNELDPKIECFWVPKFGLYADWFLYCDALYELYYGRLDRYMPIYDKLLKCEIRYYKHLKHDWYLKLVGAEPFKITTTFDKHTENPLDSYYKCNDTYLIQRRLIPKELIDRFTDVTSTERQFKLLKAIPISDVEKIYYETKDIYI